MTQALSIQQRSVPQVVEGRCVLTVDQPPPCPGDPDCPVECDGGYNYTGVEWMGHEEKYSCLICGGSGQAPPGIEIVVWVPASWTEPSEAYFHPAAVVLVGKLAEVQGLDLGSERICHRVTLVDVVVLPQPISEWEWDGVPCDGPCTPDYHNGVCAVCGGPAGKPSVASIPESWSVAPQALVDAIKEVT